MWHNYVKVITPSELWRHDAQSQSCPVSGFRHRARCPALCACGIEAVFVDARRSRRSHAHGALAARGSGGRQAEDLLPTTGPGFARRRARPRLGEHRTGPSALSRETDDVCQPGFPTWNPHWPPSVPQRGLMGNPTDVCRPAAGARSTQRQTVAMTAPHCSFPGDTNTLIASSSRMHDTTSIMLDLTPVCGGPDGAGCRRTAHAGLRPRPPSNASFGSSSGTAACSSLRTVLVEYRTQPAAGGGFVEFRGAMCVNPGRGVSTTPTVLPSAGSAGERSQYSPRSAKAEGAATGTLSLTFRSPLMYVLFLFLPKHRERCVCQGSDVRDKGS